MKISRRNVLSATISGTIGGPLVSGVFSSARRSKKIAYLSDIHLPANPEIAAKVKRAISKANRYDLVIFGGDNLMAIDFKKEPEIQAQFDQWKETIEKNLKVPYRAILGNHDIEMWDANDPSPSNGKKRSTELFKMPGRYWSDEIFGWKFIGLDTVQKVETSFVGMVDEVQLTWLKDELSKNSKPVFVAGHIPILSVTGLANSNTKPEGNGIKISTATHLANGREVAGIFREAENVKIVTSGHTHMIDRCDFGGTAYHCAGAVCGGWWNGNHEGFGPSLFEFELFDDGSFKSARVEY